MLPSPTRLDSVSSSLAAFPKANSDGAELPLSASSSDHCGLRSQQLYHILASMHAIKAQLQDHRGDEFAAQMGEAMTQAVAPLDSLVLQSFTQPRHLPSPLRDHWSVLPANRQMVAQIVEKETEQLKAEAHGLAQIRRCITARLHTDAIQAVVQHKSDHPIDDASASEIPLPVDNTRQRCAAMHADVRKIDTELQSIQAKIRQFEDVQAELQERRTPTSSPYTQHSSVHRSAPSPSLVSLHSTPSSLASHASCNASPYSSAASPAPSSARSASHFSGSSQSSPASDPFSTSHIRLLPFSPILTAASAVHSPDTHAADDDVRSAPPTPLFASPSAQPAAQAHSAEPADPGMLLLFAKLGSAVTPAAPPLVGSPQWSADNESASSPDQVSAEAQTVDNEQPGLAICISPPFAVAEASTQLPADLPVPPAEMRPLSSVSVSPLPRRSALLALAPPRVLTSQQQLLSRAPTSPLRPVMEAHVLPLDARSPRHAAAITPELQAQLDTPFSALKKQQQLLQHPHSASPLPPSSLSLLLRQQEEDERTLEAKARCFQMIKQFNDENNDEDKLYDDDDSDQEEHEEPVRCLHATDDEELDSSAPIPTPPSVSALHATPLRSGWHASFEMRSNSHLHSLRSTLQSFTDSTHAMLESPAPTVTDRSNATPPASAARSSARALLRRVQRISSENQSKQTQHEGESDAVAVASADCSKAAPLPAAAASGPASKSAAPSEWLDALSSRLPLRDITNELANESWLHSPIDQAAGSAAGMADENEPVNLAAAVSPLRYSLFRPQVSAAVLAAASRREAADSRLRMQRYAAASMISPMAAAAARARPASAPSSVASDAVAPVAATRAPARRSLPARTPFAAAAASSASAVLSPALSAASMPCPLSASSAASLTTSSSSSARRKSGEQRTRPAGTIAPTARARTGAADKSAGKPNPKPKPKPTSADAAAASSASAVPIRTPASLQPRTQAQAQAHLALGSVSSGAQVPVSCPAASSSASASVTAFVSASVAPGVENQMPD